MFKSRQLTLNVVRPTTKESPYLPQYGDSLLQLIRPWSVTPWLDAGNSEHSIQTT